MRIVVLLCGAATLSGCGDVVTSKAPLFSASDARGQAQLRPGLWAFAEASRRAPCAVDLETPADGWDSCAGPVVVRPGELLGWDHAGEPLKVEMRTVLARGSPAVMQLKAEGEDHDFQGRYIYGGVRAVKLDAQGRAIEIKAWQAMCGPPPPKDQRDGGPVTLAPVKGLTLDTDDHNCTATMQGPVREAARLSEAWSAQTGGDAVSLNWRWVRDAER